MKLVLFKVSKNKLFVIRVELHLRDHPFETSAFFRGEGVSDVCQLEGGRSISNADVSNF